MLQRPAAAVLDRYLSSRSPPDHLLYQILKMVPVWGGGSDFMVDGSTCGRAGRFFLRIIFFIFRSPGAATSVFVVVRAVDISSLSGIWDSIVGSCAVSISAMVLLFFVCDPKA